MTAYYNEIDPYAAQWLRNLIDADLIAPGEVDERDIRDVQPNDLAGYTQCHFFGGIGVWSYALRQAGWSDDRPVWSGSCPCGPFSAAGKGAGFDDERHLWPAWFWLIEQCRPGTILGEQVESIGGRTWLDLVSTDLEGIGYAVGPTDTPAAGYGAPQIRQRLYWVADAAGERCGEAGAGSGRSAERIGDSGEPCGVANTFLARDRGRQHGHAERDARQVQVAGSGLASGLADTEVPERGRASRTADSWRGASETRGSGITSGVGESVSARLEGRGAGVRQFSANAGSGGAESENRWAGTSHGFWSSCDWLPCRDGKARPVEPGVYPLVWGEKGNWAEVDVESELEPMADGVAFRVVRSSTGRALGQYPLRVGMLKGYGNALVAPQAEAFVRAYMTVGQR